MARKCRPSVTVVTPRLHSLEDRTLPASGLSTSLSGGVLRVTDWQPADTVALHQTPAGVTLDAAGTEKVFTGVARITVDVQADIRVINDTSGLGGAAARPVYLSRRAASGSGFSATGYLAPGATSGPQAAPAPRGDWFDTAIADGSLRTLTRSLARDGTLDRGDWLRVFGQVEQDGTVSATEFNDLRDLLHPDRVSGAGKPSFGVPDYVRALAADVVEGNTANALFQGVSLGNLRAGSSATQLDRLVGKWFLGTDHPQALGGATYRVVSGALFQGGASYRDVTQGNVGDCYFVAALAEVAQDSPQTLQQMFIDNGDGTFTVRFVRGGAAEYVTVDRQLPVNASGRAVYASFGGRYDSTANELWAALAEKAYVQLNEEGWLGHAALNAYRAIDGGYSDLALTHITGRAAGWVWISSASAAQLVASVSLAKPTVLASKGTNPGNGVIAAHAYSLVGYNAGNGQFTLYNPWGQTISLTWDQVRASFNGFWQAA